MPVTLMEQVSFSRVKDEESILDFAIRIGHSVSRDAFEQLVPEVELGS
jgi:hypothetical protein